MGNAPSLLFGDTWRPDADAITTTTTTDASAVQDSASPAPDEDKRASRGHEERLSEFKLELARKHEKRRQILAEKRKEMEELRQEVVRLKKENEELKQNRTLHEADASKADQDQTKEQNHEEFKESEVLRLKEENEQLRSLLEEKSKLLEASDDLVGKNRELRISVAQMQRELQGLNKQVVEFDRERQDYNAHVVALKDVIAVSKHMLQIRESQLREVS